MNHDIWLLAYFRSVYRGRVEITERGVEVVPLPDALGDETLGSDAGDGQELHLAGSRDGLHWTPLNRNRPVWPGRFVRDPFIGRGPDDCFHLVATGGRNRRSCLYARSRDLLTWEARSLPLMETVRDAAGRSVNNVWAPEWFYDRSRGEYLLFWSSSFADAGWKESRQWYSRTVDWETFTEPQVLFAPGYSVIDGTLLEHGETFYLFHKEEEFGIHTGERRGIRLATASDPRGPYQLYEGPLNRGQIVPTITEGPTVLPDPAGAGWLMLYDYPMANDYGASRSPDLWHWTTIPREEFAFPPHARHGSVFRVSDAEWQALAERYPPAFPL
uniref:GH43_18 / GH43_22 / GH43 / GH43_19 n=1 Tax=uncultured Armatimonadetes bacterium TaxID=157466 RepID=A0A6J4JUQ3_9BACT|nr:GH43_18 / GH43_22 / GH43 / GH43_19 [uncultured Armatimonadetes bacterium]